MQTTATFTDNPSFDELKQNSLLFLRQTIQDLDEYLAGDCPPESYETFTNIRKQQRAHLQQVETATHQAELHNTAPEQPAPSSEIPVRRPDGRPALRLLTGCPVT